MNRQTFRELCAARPLILDGATGTELIKRGLPSGVCPEKWAIDHADKLAEIARAYRAAGSDIVYACTFGANRAKLDDFGLADELHAVNRRAVEICRAALDTEKPGGFVAGDLAPTGKMLEPYGETPVAEIHEIYREQTAALVGAGCDLLVIETMMDLEEAAAALRAAREVTADLPIMVTMTYAENGRTMYGADPLTVLARLQELGADAIGCNCSVGPQKMVEWIALMKPHTAVPLIAKPNAGQPKLVNGKTTFDLGPTAFAAAFPALIAAGAGIVGGCCGSTPEHLAALRAGLENNS